MYNKPTVLSKILGLFSIQINKKGELEYFVVMENINFGLLGKQLKVYDLKGSKSNRFRDRSTIGQTLLDTNYNLERNGDPLSFKPPQNLDLFQAILNDSKFLARNEIVDYSLLLVMDIENKIIKVGIIDYLQNYNLFKKTEYLLKKFKNLGKNPTIVKPNIYAKRFYNQMKRDFVQLDGDYEELRIRSKSKKGGGGFKKSGLSSSWKSGKPSFANSSFL